MSRARPGLAGRTFRANRGLRLVTLDQLEASQRDALEPATRDEGFYGFAVPADGAGATIKAVTRDAALLWYTLREPAALPDYARRQLGADADETLAGLVLSGLLEIECGGAFASGPAAHDAVLDAGALRVSDDRVGRMSLDAIRYAAELPIREATLLSARMYFFNRVPASPRWFAAYPSAAAVREALGVTGETGGVLRRTWSEVGSAPEEDGWLKFSARSVGEAKRAGGSTYKLYVSPTPAQLPEAFRAAVPDLAAAGVSVFKVAADAYGVLRPDKLVAYFRSQTHLQEVAAQLAATLSGCEAQGVPFTSALTPDGLLSWGADPPRSHHLLAWRERESWRLWITNRLASAIIGAGDGDPTAAALHHLERQGVDTQRWTPTFDTWGEP